MIIISVSDMCKYPYIRLSCVTAGCFEMKRCILTSLDCFLENPEFSAEIAILFAKIYVLK